MFDDLDKAGLTLEILVIIILVLINGLLAMSEIALVKSSKFRLRELAQKGKKGAGYALTLIRSPNRFLSTIQVGITLMGILSGVYGGAVIAAHLEPLIRGLPYIGPYSSTASYFLVVIIITYLLLVFGELIPKRLALLKPEEISSAVAPPMLILSRLAAPAVFVLSLSTDGVLRLFGITRHKEEPPSEDEIKHMFRHGARTGVFEPSEIKLVERVLRLDDQPVGTLMTRPEDIIMFRQSDSFGDILRKARQTKHTCYPLVEYDLDQVLGIVQAKDLLTAAGEERPDLKKILRPAVYVKEHVNALDILDLFKKSRAHMILVTDNSGRIRGLLTINDILQAIIGDLSAPEWPEEPWIVQRKDGSLLLDGRLSTGKLKEILNLRFIPGEERCDTLAELVMDMLEIPVSGAGFDLKGYHFEVMDMDGMKVDKVLVKKLSPEIDK